MDPAAKRSAIKSLPCRSARPAEARSRRKAALLSACLSALPLSVAAQEEMPPQGKSLPAPLPLHLTCLLAGGVDMLAGAGQFRELADLERWLKVSTRTYDYTVL